MTLKEFNELYLGKAVHCKIEELANKFLGLANGLGFVWNDGEKLTKFNRWNTCKDKTYYRVYHDIFIVYGCVDNISDLKIIEFKGEIKND